MQKSWRGLFGVVAVASAATCLFECGSDKSAGPTSTVDGSVADASTSDDGSVASGDDSGIVMGGMKDAGIDTGPLPVTGAFTSALVFDDTSVPYGVATDAVGNVTVVGTYASPSFSIGGQLMGGPGQGGNDIFIVRLGPNNGVLWSLEFGAAGDDLAAGVALDGNGNVYVAGAVDVLATALPASVIVGYDKNANAVSIPIIHSDVSSFVVKIDPNGKPIWATTFDLAGSSNTVSMNECSGVAVSSQGTVAVSCAIGGTIVYALSDGGTGTRTKPIQHGNPAGWVTELDSTTGAVLSGTMVTNGYGTAMAGVGYDSKGELFTGGRLNVGGAAQFDFPDATIGDDNNSKGLWFAKLSGPTTSRSLAWGRAFTPATFEESFQPMPQGGTWIAGTLAIAADFGLGAIAPAGAPDCFVLALDPNGKPTSQTTFGAQGTVACGLGIAPRVAADDVGNPIVTTSYQGNGFVLGGMSVPDAPNRIALIAKLDPLLKKVLWVFEAPTSGDGGTVGSTITALATNPATGQSVATGYFGGTIDLGNGKPFTRNVAAFILRRER